MAKLTALLGTLCFILVATSCSAEPQEQEQADVKENASEPIARSPEIRADGLSERFVLPDPIATTDGLAQATPGPPELDVSGELKWWIFAGDGVNQFRFSLITLEQSQIAGLVGIDQEQRFEEYVERLSRCGQNAPASLEGLRSNLSSLDIPGLGWRELNGFGIGISSEELAPQADPIAAVIDPQSDCAADAQSAVYGSGMTIVDLLSSSLAEDLVLRSNPPVVYLVRRDSDWQMCMQKFGLQFGGWRDVQNYLLAIYGLVDLDGVQALDFDAALEVEVRIARADWVCSEDSRADADLRQADQERTLLEAMSEQVDLILSSE